MSGLLAFTKMAFAAPRLTMAVGVNSIAARAYATKKLFIGNIPWGTTDEEVKEFFVQYGEPKDFYVPKDNMGRTKGFAFIEFEDAEADKAVEDANGREFNGRPLRVDVANARTEGDRPRRNFNDRDNGDRQFRPRRDDRGGDRQFRPRRDFNDNGERSFRPRRDYGDSGDRSFRRPREDSGDRE
ncbi:hypothetical protein BGZ46_004664 [Entomortierella lignicola]|nr:hypothetical protein BGZ46_004664 [Entomortierella lignicola]KAF9204371.1 hypothetical protein BGZ49_005385 [Haplosporangium sp. Z 27]